MYNMNSVHLSYRHPRADNFGQRRATSIHLQIVKSSVVGNSQSICLDFVHSQTFHCYLGQVKFNDKISKQKLI